MKVNTKEYIMYRIAFKIALVATVLFAVTGCLSGCGAV